MIDRSMIDSLTADQAHQLGKSYACLVRELFARAGRGQREAAAEFERAVYFNRVQCRERTMAAVVDKALAGGAPDLDAYRAGAEAVNAVDPTRVPIDAVQVQLWYRQVRLRRKRISLLRLNLRIVKARLRGVEVAQIARRLGLNRRSVWARLRAVRGTAPDGDLARVARRLAREIERLRNPWPRPKRPPAVRRAALDIEDILEGDTPIKLMIDRHYDRWRALADIDDRLSRALPSPADWRAASAPAAVAAAAREDAIVAEIDELDEDIRATPSLGPLGIALKLRFALCEMKGSSFSQRHQSIIESALDDASRLCGGADAFNWARELKLLPTWTRVRRAG